MQSPTETLVPRSLMVELIDLLGEFPSERNRRQAEVFELRLADLERRARTQGAASQTVAAIQGARVLFDLAELPPLPASKANS